ncbi:MAG TPA: hypothetical protein VNL35_00950 [Chloroflexota bacterium]|nr:hypothetical protein [Chloroflexota bacterium]
MKPVQDVNPGRKGDGGGGQVGRPRIRQIFLGALLVALAAMVLWLRFGAAPTAAPVVQVIRATATVGMRAPSTPSRAAATATATVPPTNPPVSNTPAAGNDSALPIPPTASATASGTPLPSSTSALPTMTPTNPRATATGTPTPEPTNTSTVTPIPPTATPRSCAGAMPRCTPEEMLPGRLLIADSGNSRLVEVTAAKHVLWTFPRPGDLLPGQAFVDPDDAFFTPDWQSIVTNQEGAQTLGRIDYRTHRLTWQYGHLYTRGSAPGYLNEPDDAYQLPNGLVTVADIRNCRILFLSPKGTVARQYGITGYCVHDPPRTFASPNGDTPLPDGGMLVTEIGGNHVDRLSATGKLIFDLTIPWVSYASDAQLLADGSVLLADYSRPGNIVRVSTRGQLLWRYAPTQASDILNHPSLAIMLPNGLIAANDDWNHRVVLIDPARQAIVWQYGVTGVPGSAPGYLDIPDGVDFHPASSLAAIGRMVKATRAPPASG